MAESGAGGAGGIGEFLQNYSNVGSLFFAFIIAGLIPGMRYITKKYTKWKDAKDAEQALKEKAAIIELAKEVQQPLTDRMNKVEEVLEKFAKQNEAMLDHMNIIEQLLQSGRVSFQRGPGRPSKHYNHSAGKGDHSHD